MCIGAHVRKVAKFDGHEFSVVGSSLIDEATGRAFLAKFQLGYVPSSCPTHDGQTLTGLVCLECTPKDAPLISMCLMCAKIHSAAWADTWEHSSHVLTPIPDGRSLRERLKATTLAPVKGCIAQASQEVSDNEQISEKACDDNPSHLHSADAETAAQGTGGVACARHKALTLQQELDALEGFFECARQTLVDNHAAAVAALQAGFDAHLAALTKTLESKQFALQNDLVTADTALEESIAATTASLEVSSFTHTYKYAG